MVKSRKLAITGANGYLGTHTIKKAIQQGWDIIGVIRREEVAKEIESLGAIPIIIKDFESRALENAFEGCMAIIHFANIVCGSKELFHKINVIGIQNIIKAAKRVNLSKIIYPSGLGVNYYGKTTWANNEYFHSKSLAEKEIIESGILYTIFRPSYILGPGDELIPEILNQIWDGKVLIAGTGKIPMQPIYVENAVSAFLAAAEGKVDDNMIYDLVGPKELTMLQLVEIIYEKMDELGVRLPHPYIEHIPINEAAERLGLCEEMIQVMLCDLVSDGSIAANSLGYELLPIENAIEHTIIEHLNLKKLNGPKKALILLSGGLDSAVALYWAKSKGYKITTLSINYEYRPEKEKLAAKELSKEVGAELIEISLPYLKGATDLLFEGFPIPTAINSAEGYIPQRNLIFYSIAAYYAEINGITRIIGGHLAQDEKSFPDASKDFFSQVEDLAGRGKPLNSTYKVRILTPFINMSKAEVVQLAKTLNVPLELTWSCYSDGEEHCGRCSSCISRQNALEASEK